MEPLLAALRAAAEPTRLRLLALAATGAFCVTEFTEILGQSQPRLSRHLKLLCEAGLLGREREGANVWFIAPPGPAGALTRELLARLPAEDPVLAADRREAARVLAERARIASETFQRQGADWDEMRALDLDAATAEAALVSLVPAGAARLLDIATGTGRVLELLAPRVAEGLGIDASPAMLALARARLSRAGAANCAVRRADMYRLPLADGGFDLAVLQMVLHYAEEPARVLAEAARVLAPGGRLIAIDLARHDRADLATRHAHRRQGFSDSEMTALLAEAGLAAGEARAIAPARPGGLTLRLWTAAVPADATAELVA
ncbi:MAG: metalloregulator ArsR/SmtB family transcription factor [Rhodospirillales bacterium]|nr:metalloregulator ArsR/SmtB family transcription factor [Rhodospirillales bacterium]